MQQSMDSNKKIMNNLILLIVETMQKIYWKIHLYLRKRRAKKQLARVRSMFNQSIHQSNQSSHKSTSIPKLRLSSSHATFRKKTKATGVNSKKQQAPTKSKLKKQSNSVKSSKNLSKAQHKSRKTTKN